MEPAEPYFTTLTSHVARGDGFICLASRTPLVHAIVINPGQPREERVYVWRNTGSGPHIMWLGADAKHPMETASAHASASIVKIEPVSPELADALRRIALGGCSHPKATPVLTQLEPEVVAWLCPDCDEALPLDWRLAHSA